MYCDKNMIFTALTADNLKVGDEVIVANSLAELTKLVEFNAEPKKN